MADAVIPGIGVWRDALLVLSGSLLVAVCAQFVVPFYPVPVTGQTFGVLLTGMLLGSKRGSLALVAYVAEGIAGLPVFYGGRAGPGQLIGPTGGYLIGFIVAAFVAGWLAERGWDRRFATAAAAMVIGNIVIYFFGVAWLAYIYQMGVSWLPNIPLKPVDAALVDGMVKFIPGDFLKIGLATAALPSGWRLIERFR
jgi:biotin transport system substrate-specific component